VSEISERQDRTKTCTTCCDRAKDAIFVHGRVSHRACCYPCAKLIFAQKGVCPVCRRKIEKITKLFEI